MSRRYEERVEAVRSALASDSPAARRVIEQTLSLKDGNLIALVATKVDVADEKMRSRLVDAFFRLCEDAAKRDPGCRAKYEILKALYDAETNEPRLFEAAVRYVQEEPGWGGGRDTAAQVRGLSAMALAFFAHPRALSEIARLLADREPAARIAAVEALAASGQTLVAEPLLQLRLAFDEPEPEVRTAYLRVLLEVAPDEAFVDVTRFLDSPRLEIANTAALALGESRLERALPHLLEGLESLPEAAIEVRLLSVALLRSDAAWSRLLGLVSAGSDALAEGAAKAPRTSVTMAT